VRWRVNCFI